MRSPTGGRGDRFVDNATTISGVDISSANGAYVPAAQCEMLLGADLSCAIRLAICPSENLAKEGRCTSFTH